MRLLHIGPDFALGRNREGTMGALRRIGRDLGFRVEAADLLVEEGEKVGSSAVREALEASGLTGYMLRTESGDILNARDNLYTRIQDGAKLFAAPRMDVG